MKDTHRQQYRATFVDASEAPQLLIDEVFLRLRSTTQQHNTRKKLSNIQHKHIQPYEYMYSKNTSLSIFED